MRSAVLNGRARLSAPSDWLAVADLLAGLMVVFVLLWVAALRQLPDDPQAPAREQIAERLVAALRGQLQHWDARFDRATLSVDFGAPALRFAPASAQLSARYRRQLADFFPRYLDAIAAHREQIEEVRIEGHTSSRWEGAADPDSAWIENMTLSQARTRAVLVYLHSLPAVAPWREWLRSHVVAAGLSSARPLTLPDGSEDRDRSRRVSIRLVLRAD